MGINPSDIIVDCYKRRQGRVIRFDVPSLEALSKLRAAFYDLSQGTILELSLAGLNYVALTPSVAEIVLKLTKQDHEPSRSVKLRAELPAGAVFLWTRYSEGWLECAELLDGLTEGGRQYLNRGSSDDAEIEVSFRENRIRSIPQK